MTAVAPQIRSTHRARPRFEGSNICSWIGFKHVMYLVEEAVLEHLRQRGLAPRELYERHGLGTEIVDSDTRILTALHLDDLVRTEVSERADDSGRDELVLRAESFVDPPGRDPVKAVSATVRVVWRAEPAGSGGEPGQPALAAAHTVPRIDRAAGPPGPAVDLAGRGATGDPLAALAGGNSFSWRWRVPYFYCHFSDRLQHSGYLRLMEEVVDLFLASRGLSIATMLGRHRWIPVVPRARVELLAEARMEEELYTVFTVEEVFKNLTYTGRMDCYVHRAGRLVPTATGRITHGYATVLNRRDWQLVEFDEATGAALRGAPGPAS
jgi:acyl-CoA thioesterase FadM